MLRQIISMRETRSTWGNGTISAVTPHRTKNWPLSCFWHIIHRTFKKHPLFLTRNTQSRLDPCLSSWLAASSNQLSSRLSISKNWFKLPITTLATVICAWHDITPLHSICIFLFSTNIYALFLLQRFFAIKRHDLPVRSHSAKPKPLLAVMISHVGKPPT